MIRVGMVFLCFVYCDRSVFVVFIVRGNSIGELGREVSKYLIGMFCRIGLEGIFFFFWNWTEFVLVRVWGFLFGILVF